MEAVVISGLPSSGKTTLAIALAGKIGVPMLGGTDILKQMAMDRGYHPVGDDWWDTQEGLRFLNERSGNLEFDREADRRLCQVVEKGNVIITSWTVPWLTKTGFKIWLSANLETRAKRMSMRDHTDVPHALETVAKRDKENYALYKRLYGIDFGNDLKPFDLVIETDGKEAVEVADAAMMTLRERKVIA